MNYEYCKVPYTTYHWFDERLLLKQITISKSEQPIIIYGAGYIGKVLLRHLNKIGMRVACFCDQNEALRFCEDLQVITPSELSTRYCNNLILISALRHADIICQTLISLGITPENLVIPQFNNDRSIIVPVAFLADNALSSYEKYQLNNNNNNNISIQKFSAPKVQIYTQVYNTPETYLRRAIESVMSQTYTDFEYLLIDNGSNNYAADIIQQYADTDARISVVRFDINNSKLSNDERTERNKWKAERITSRCPYVCTLDSDDYYEPNFVETALSLMIDYNADLVVGRTCVYQESQPEQYYLRQSPLGVNLYEGKNSILSMLCDYGIHLASIWGKLYRADLLRRTLLYCDTAWSRNIEDVVRSYYAFATSERIILTDQVMHYWTRRTNTITLGINENVKLIERYLNVNKWLSNLFEEMNYNDNRKYNALNYLLYNMALGTEVDLLESVIKSQPEYVIRTVDTCLKADFLTLHLSDDKVQLAFERLIRAKNEANSVLNDSKF